MPVENNPDGIEDLNAAWPAGSEPKSEGDDHLRNIKAAVQGSFPNMNGPNQIDAKLGFQGADAGGLPIENMGNGITDQDAATIKQLDEVKQQLSGVVAWGGVGSNGSFANSPGSENWSAVRTGPGKYTLTFDDAASVPDDVNQSLIIQPKSTAVRIGSTQFVNGTTMNVIIQGYEGSDIDTAFDFIRITHL